MGIETAKSEEDHSRFSYWQQRLYEEYLYGESANSTNNRSTYGNTGTIFPGGSQTRTITSPAERGREASGDAVPGAAEEGVHH